MSLSTEAVTHGINGTGVLEGVSIDLEPGEILAIIGPSGTGKTTLLRLLALFNPPDAGTINIDGRDVWALPERDRLAIRREIAMVFQQPNLFDTSVFRNVRYGLHLRTGWGERILRWSGGRNTDLTDQVTDALDLVGMADDVDQAADALSGGEAQRVAFARALAVEPSFLLLDEPTSDLDPRNTAMIEEAVAAAQARDIGVVIATHDMHQAERVASQVAVMLNGQIIEYGPTDQVFDNPEDPRARQFIDGELVF